MNRINRIKGIWPLLKSRFRQLDKPAPIADISPDVWELMMYNFANGMPPSKGLFIVMQGSFRFTAVDNLTGPIRTKDFDDRFAAERWLRSDKL